VGGTCGPIYTAINSLSANHAYLKTVDKFRQELTEGFVPRSDDDSEASVT